MPGRFMRTVRVAFGGRCLAAKSREPIASSVPADFARRFKRLRSLFASSRRKLYLLAEYFAPSARPLARRPNESHLIFAIRAKARRPASLQCIRLVTGAGEAPTIHPRKRCPVLPNPFRLNRVSCLLKNFEPRPV